MTWLLPPLLLWGAATLLVALLMPLFRQGACAWGLLDRPRSEGHKNHAQATPVVGGAAMGTVWFLLLAVCLRKDLPHLGFRQAAVFLHTLIKQPGKNGGANRFVRNLRFDARS